jgi:hypothetical protein
MLTKWSLYVPYHQPVTHVRTLQLGAAEHKRDVWLPYERGFSENSILFPWIPRHFYQFRWLLVNGSPLSRRVGRKQFTWGEALVVFALVAEMVWMAAMVAINPVFRVNVRRTGARLLSLLMHADALSIRLVGRFCL